MPNKRAGAAVLPATGPLALSYVKLAAEALERDPSAGIVQAVSTLGVPVPPMVAWAAGPVVEDHGGMARIETKMLQRPDYARPGVETFHYARADDGDRAVVFVLAALLHELAKPIKWGAIIRPLLVYGHEWFFLDLSRHIVRAKKNVRLLPTPGRNRAWAL